MTDQLPSKGTTKDLFSAVKEFDEWNEVTGALPDHTSWNYECRSILEDADKEISKLRELVTHCWIHSAYANCGYYQMTTEQKAMYDAIIKVASHD